MKIAIYPGSFDPFHVGHLNILKKSSSLFDKIFVVISLNINKQSELDFEARKTLAIKMTEEFKNVDVLVNYDKLTTDKAAELNAKYLIRGLRSQDDFNHELEYYDGIKQLDPNIEIIYFVSDQDSREISSTILKEIQHFKKGI